LTRDAERIVREARGVYAVKGSDNLASPMSRGSRANRDKVKVFSFNATHFKETLFPRLSRVTAGPGYIHIGNETETGVDKEFLRQFGAEKRLREWVRGRAVVRYVKIANRRNEAIDLYNMALVALRALGATFIKGLERGAPARPAEGDSGEPALEPRAEAQPALAPAALALPRPSVGRRRGGGWASRWKN